MFLCAASICVSYLKKFPESLSSPLLTDPKLLLLFIKFLKLSHPITIRVRSPFPSKPKKLKHSGAFQVCIDLLECLNLIAYLDFLLH